MKRIASLFVVAAALAASTAQAGGPQGYGRGVRITRVDATSTGLVAIRLDAVDALAICATLDPVQQAAYLIDPTTDSGQALYANVLFAASSNAIVDLFGTGSCSLYSVPNPGGSPINGQVEFLGRISAPPGL